MSDKAIRSTTQEFLDVYDIVSDMVLLKDGTAAVILQVGTMNFSLLAEQEQDAVIFTYGSLLNSLNYPIQINIQSQTKDATKYLRLLDEQIKKASSDRKATLIKQYRDFVAALIKERNVLQKRFYIIVPASPAEMGLITPSSVLPGKNAFDINSVEKSILIEKAINLLEPRTDHLTSQFNRLGLYVRQLSTQEIIQNFYINYNPEAVEGQEISSSENYTTPLVRASFGGKFMPLNNQASNPEQNQPEQSQVNQEAPLNLEVPPASSSSPTAEDILSNNPIEQTGSKPNEAATDPMQTVEQAADQVAEQTSAQPPQEKAYPAEDAQDSLPVIPTNNVTEPEVQAVELNLPDQAAPQLENVVNDVQATSIQAAEPATVLVDTQPNTQEQLPELNINLDSSLVDSGFPKVAAEDPQLTVEQAANEESQQNPVEQSQQNTEPAQEISNDFAEDIVPLQNKFDAPTPDAASGISPDINQDQTIK